MPEKTINSIVEKLKLLEAPRCIDDLKVKEEVIWEKSKRLSPTKPSMLA